MLEEQELFLIGSPDLPEAVEIELPDEGWKLGVPEVLRQDLLDELRGIPHYELVLVPSHNVPVSLVLQNLIELEDEVSRFGHSPTLLYI